MFLLTDGARCVLASVSCCVMQLAGQCSWVRGDSRSGSRTTRKYMHRRVDVERERKQRSLHIYLHIYVSVYIYMYECSCTYTDVHVVYEYRYAYV